MDVNTAKQLCILAHKDQWRRPIEMTDQEVHARFKVESIPIDKYFYLPEGGRFSYCELNEEYLYEEPYSSHPIAVADMMTTDEEKIVAYLHDVIEDTDWILVDNAYGWWLYLPATKEASYQELEITENMYEAIYAITRYNDHSYKQYLNKVNKNKLATKVKIADIVHNLSCNPSDHAKQKYLKALPVLLATL
jgi:hypothetical protein